MNLFITGGSGFVGKSIIPILIKKGYTVHALVRSEKSKNVVENLGAIAVLDELTALSSVTEKVLKDCQYLVHSAALMDFTYDPAPFNKINIEATQELVKLAKKAGVQKFIYISAAPVVAGSPIVNLSEDQASTKLPTALYPKTKAIAERFVLKANSSTFKTISLRPPAIWGPNNHHYDDLLENVSQGKWRWIGGGEHILSTIHIKNLANAIVAALESDQGGKAYFVTDGERRSLKSFFSALLKAEGLDPGEKTLPRGVAVMVANTVELIWKTFRLKSRPPIAPLMIRLMGTEFSVSDQKARKELNYKNAISIDEGMKELENKSSL